MTPVYYIIYKLKADNSLAVQAVFADNAQDALDKWFLDTKYQAVEPVFVHPQHSPVSTQAARRVYRVEKVNEPKYKLFG